MIDKLLVHSDLALGMKLYAKKPDDVWYKGTLVDIINSSRAASEVCLSDLFICVFHVRSS